jgi:hypothetical protein
VRALIQERRRLAHDSAISKLVGEPKGNA